MSVSSIIHILRDAYVLLSNVFTYLHIYVPLYTSPCVGLVEAATR